MKSVYVVQNRYVDEADEHYTTVMQFDSKLDAINEAKRVSGKFDYLAVRVVERIIKTEDTVIEQFNE